MRERRQPSYGWAFRLAGSGLSLARGVGEIGVVAVEVGEGSFDDLICSRPFADEEVGAATEGGEMLVDEGRESPFARLCSHVSPCLERARQARDSLHDTWRPGLSPGKSQAGTTIARSTVAILAPTSAGRPSGRISWSIVAWSQTAWRRLIASSPDIESVSP